MPTFPSMALQLLLCLSSSSFQHKSFLQSLHLRIILESLYTAPSYLILHLLLLFSSIGNFFENIFSHSSTCPAHCKEWSVFVVSIYPKLKSYIPTLTKIIVNYEELFSLPTHLHRSLKSHIFIVKMLHGFWVVMQLAITSLKTNQLLHKWYQ